MGEWNLRFLAAVIGRVGAVVTRMRLMRWLEELVRELSARSTDLDILSLQCL